MVSWDQDTFQVLAVMRDSLGPSTLPTTNTLIAGLRKGKQQSCQAARASMRNVGPSSQVYDIRTQHNAKEGITYVPTKGLTPPSLASQVSQC